VRPGGVPLCWMLVPPAIAARSHHPPLPPAVTTPRRRRQSLPPLAACRFRHLAPPARGVHRCYTPVGCTCCTCC